MTNKYIQGIFINRKDKIQKYVHCVEYLYAVWPIYNVKYQ